MWIELSLKTAKATKQLTLPKYLVAVITNINIGDVVYVEPSIGIVKRLGRSETKADEYDLEGDRYIQLTKSGVHATKEREILLSLYDFDYAFNKYNDDISMFSRRHVDDVIISYLKLGIARFVDSCVFIESANLFSSSDLGLLARTVQSYPSLKVVIAGSGLNEEYIKDYFFKTTPNSDENIVELVEYFMKSL